MRRELFICIVTNSERQSCDSWMLEAQTALLTKKGSLLVNNFKGTHSQHVRVRFSKDDGLFLQVL